VEEARESGVKLRVSGQRHSQPPLVIEDNRSDPPRTARTWLIDLSCYADLGPEGDQQIELDVENKTVTVNAGVREDYLDAFLTANDLMLPTVTAGGFFSLGGMTAVDVHGATLDAPIFAETVSAFTLMGADGKMTTIGRDDPGIDGWGANLYTGTQYRPCAADPGKGRARVPDRGAGRHQAAVLPQPPQR